MRHRLRQLSILHISDLHFGVSHRFDPPATPSSDVPVRRGMPTLFGSLKADFEASQAESPVVIAVTGDLAQRAAQEEFDQAARLLARLTETLVLGHRLFREDIFVVPGNHDVIFTEPKKERRWQPYCSFYQNFFRKPVYTDAPEELNRVHDRSSDLGAIVVELNSCVSVMKGSPDEQRGQIDIGSIQSLRKQLEAIDQTKLQESIRIALVHHHPILLPAFAESSRGYDCIINADKLLMVLRDFGFHLILHGHKHFPHTFSYDAQCAWTREEANPTIVVAGGSAGSRDLSQLQIACNTYNRITIKWNPDANEGRVLIETRGLVTSDEYGRELLPGDWHWRTARIFDRLITPQRHMPPEANTQSAPFDKGESEHSESLRIQQYKKLRGNMPVVEVMPSLHGDQAYEARVWIESHRRSDKDIPDKVIWSAGKMFGMTICNCDDNPHFCTGFEYWGPMLIQARLFFKDGERASGFVYARLPSSRY
jgi:predicted MPP superfamily phosphohydrolase